MRVYVAGASAELERVEAFAARAIAAGHEIAHAWWEDVRANVAAGRTDADLSDDEGRRFADADLSAVADSDAFVLLAPAGHSRGCWLELGHALAFVPCIIVAGASARSSIFTRAAGVDHLVADDTDALLALEAT